MLADMKVRQAKATGKPYTSADFDGLSLFVSASGSKTWHFRYTWVGQRSRISLGSYPELSLRDEARSPVAKGINPRTDRKQKRQSIRQAGVYTFMAVYEKWMQHRQLTLEEGRQSSLEQIPRAFKKDVFPFLKRLTIYEITRPHLLEVIGRIEKRNSLLVAEKVRTWLKQLFDNAMVVVPDMETNPTTDLHVVAVPLPPVEHNPFLRMTELPELLQTLRKYRGRLTTQLAIRLLLLTVVRTGELRLATPDQFDLERGLWIIPAQNVKQLQNRMRKSGRRPQDVPHYIVPLSLQTMEVVRYLLGEVKPAQRYHQSDLKKRISENTLNTALRRMGYKERLTGHGIRGTISTALNEIGYPKTWVDAQL
jgi:integrase